MPVGLYMDEHIPRAITVELRLRNVDIVTAQEDEATGMPDPELLDRAAQLQRVLFTFDDDLLTEAVRRQRENISFQGVIYAHPLRISIGACVLDLEVVAKAAEPKDLASRVEFLPL